VLLASDGTHDAVQDGRASNRELMTLTEVSELGLAYTLQSGRGKGKKRAGLRSLGAVSRMRSPYLGVWSVRRWKQSDATGAR
jgi:hypothetical protein